MKRNRKNKRSKRANGEGCIRQLKDGRWEARITDGYTSDGKQHWKTFSSKKQSVVIKKLDDYKTNRDKFKDENIVKYTISQWLNIWYETYVINNVRISTRISYESIINNHLIHYIGNIKLVNLSKIDIESMYNKLIKCSKNRTNGNGLSVKTVRNIHLVLHEALQEALELGYINKNPADIAKVPTLKNLNQKKKEIEIYLKDEQKKLIEISKKDKIYGTVVIMALYTGMRKGEILGLQWDDINFENKTINVNKQLSRLKDYETTTSRRTKLFIQYNTKTNNSTRIIPMAKTLEDILKQQKELQQEYKRKLGKKYYKYNMVFCREDGYYLDPDTVLSKYQQLAKKAGIKKCTFHALRHTFATRALESNMSPKVVSKILGHTSVQFTLDTYTHVLSELQIDEMGKLDKYLNTILI